VRLTLLAGACGVKEGHVHATPWWFAPKEVKGLIEKGDLIVTVNQKRPQRVVEVGPPSNVHVLQCLHKVDHLARVHVEAQTAQKTTEKKQIMQ
jgi:hypothetical protein